MSTTPRYEFYETDTQLTLSVFDRGADPEKVSVKFTPTSLAYENEDKKLSFEPLQGEIKESESRFRVGKVKVEITLAKVGLGRWGTIQAKEDKEKPTMPMPSEQFTPPAFTALAAEGAAESLGYKAPPKPRKNWDKITTNILSTEKEVTTSEDPNAGGDTALNGFFQKIFADADEDTKRAMMKSYVESGGTSLSTNWDEVSKTTMEPKPPQGQEYKKWGV